MSNGDALYATWLRAASDLGIEIEQIGDAVLVSSFGPEAGMLCALRDTPDEWKELADEAAAMNAGYSVLSPAHLTYDRMSYIEMLIDWGWSGKDAPPTWYEEADPT
jgi:hypothetical protein